MITPEERKQISIECHLKCGHLKDDVPCWVACYDKKEKDLAFQKRLKTIQSKLIHYLVAQNYYACIRAVGNGVRGIATKNRKLVTCKNCLAYISKNPLHPKYIYAYDKKIDKRCVFVVKRGTATSLVTGISFKYPRKR